MFLLALVALSLLALLWLALLLSPLHAWTHRNPLNAATKIVASDEALPPVTFVVPARNEERWLPITVPSYCEQDYPGVRVVLIDDQSDDGSPAILEKLKVEHSNLSVVHAGPRPEGWCGKPWAVWEGVRFAICDLRFAIENSQSQIANRKSQMPWFLFTDADCIFHPSAVRQAMKLAQSGGYDAVSLLAQMDFGSALERVGLAGLATVLNLVMPMAASNNPKRGVALAAGGFILVRAGAYEAVGGHEAVKAHIVEDVQLGRRLKGAGFKLHTRATADLVRTRMYEGFGDLWEGLAKNAYAGMDYAPEKFWVGLIVSIFVAVLPPVYFFATLFVAVRTHSTRAWVLFALSALVVISQALIHLRTVRHMKLPAWHCLLMPASAAMYTAATCHSAYQNHFGGGNVWKGRRYGRAMLVEAGKPSVAPESGAG